MYNENNINYWFPLLQGSGVCVPETVIVETDVNLCLLIDGETPDGFEGFICELKSAGEKLSYPAFLRTGHGSGKHTWRETCYVRNPGDFATHVANLVEWSELAALIGLPYQTWALRKMLPLVTSFRAFSGRMPINCERRYFFSDGTTLCHHPYWPEDAIHTPSTEVWRELLIDLNRETPEEVELLTGLTNRVARHFAGAWSLDWAKTVDGKWYAVDMALMATSFHWLNCPHTAKEQS